MDGLADVSGIASHLDREPHFTDQIAGMRAENATAENTTASRASSESVEVNSNLNCEDSLLQTYST